MVMDVKLLPLIDQAESGDTEAMWELALAYSYGKGVKKDKRSKKYYLMKLLEKPDQLEPTSVGSMLSDVGDLCFDLREFDEAAIWYMKSIRYFLVNYPINEAQKMIEECNAEVGLEDTFYWSIQLGNLPPLT